MVKTKRKHYRNSLRLFLIFIAGLLLYGMVASKGLHISFGVVGGVSMVYSIIGFLVNAEVIKD